MSGVPVLFRKDKHGVIVAVFPTIAPDRVGYDMTCYSRVGQHGSCSRTWYWTTRPAKPDEYAALKRELEAPPHEYSLKLVPRITWQMDEMRRPV